MRIIAGQFRGRRLKALPGTTIRPTSDKLRETLFNILAPWIEGAVFIDCYAGTGAVGLEALSRGARKVYLVESEAPALRAIEQNLSWLPSRNAIQCIRASVRLALSRLAAADVHADFCFFDPPYSALPGAVEQAHQFAASQRMNPGGWIILEHSKRDLTPEMIGDSAHPWKRIRLLQQGSSALSFYRQDS